MKDGLNWDYILGKEKLVEIFKFLVEIFIYFFFIVSSICLDFSSSVSSPVCPENGSSILRVSCKNC